MLIHTNEGLLMNDLRLKTILIFSVILLVIFAIVEQANHLAVGEVQNLLLGALALAVLAIATP